MSGVGRTADVALVGENLLVHSLDVALQVAGVAGLVRALATLQVPPPLVDRLLVIVEVHLPVTNILAALLLTFEPVQLLAEGVPATILATIIF